MRSQYVVTYDICDPKRLRAVFLIMKGFGDHMQLSVFRCDLTPTEVIDLKAQLADAIHHGADQVLFFNLGPSDGRAKDCVSAVGRPPLPVVRGPVVV